MLCGSVLLCFLCRSSLPSQPLLAARIQDQEHQEFIQAHEEQTGQLQREKQQLQEQNEQLKQVRFDSLCSPSFLFSFCVRVCACVLFLSRGCRFCGQREPTIGHDASCRSWPPSKSSSASKTSAFGICRISSISMSRSSNNVVQRYIHKKSKQQREEQEEGEK